MILWSITLLLTTLQIVGSMSPPSAVGRAPLSTRFTARVRILSMTFPDRDALQAVYTAMVQRVSGGACIEDKSGLKDKL